MTRERWQVLLLDAALGLGIAFLVVLLVVFASHTEPTFIYQAF